jgi:hypothetical protein
MDDAFCLDGFPIRVRGRIIRATFDGARASGGDAHGWRDRQGVTNTQPSDRASSATGRDNMLIKHWLVGGATTIALGIC